MDALDMTLFEIETGKDIECADDCDEKENWKMDDLNAATNLYIYLFITYWKSIFIHSLLLIRLLNLQLQNY